MMELRPEVRAAYLERLGVEADAPSVDGLRLLHRRHAERIPYETLWIHGDERWNIDPHAAAQRIALENRGGYCYHLNGAFGLLLRSLGYRVKTHTGGVHGPEGHDRATHGNHLVLTVDELATDDNPDGRWYVDVGLGDALHEPILLAAGSVQQGPFRLTLTRSESLGSGWHLEHDPAGGFTGMAWSLDPADETLMARQHAWLSTSPESGFVKLGLAQTRDDQGVDVMHGLVVKRIGSNARSSEPIADRRAWFDALCDLFGLTFASSPPGTTDRLWERTLVTHAAWESTRLT